MNQAEYQFEYSPAELSSIVDKIENDAFSNFMRVRIQRMVRWLLKRINHLAIINQQVIFNQKGNFVLTANHSSHLDVFCLLSCLPENKINNTYAVVAEDYFFSNDIIAYLSRILVNSLPISRGRGAYSGIKACMALLDRGKNLIIFPEGTRSKTGEMQPFRSGIGLLMAERKEPVIPIFIDGAYKAMPKGRFLPKRVPITVRIGDAINFEKYQNDEDGWQLVANEIENRIKAQKGM
jgi:1-acyl-sn-glycerol-3-phosphate acyltransferase